MIKQRDFWLGFVAGCIVMFFYAWFSIWVTYTALERAYLGREAELESIKKIVFYGRDIHSQREEAVEWNRQAIKPVPVKADDNE